MSAVVTWRVKVNVPAPCPEYHEDPYTGQPSMYQCAVAHFETITRKMRREFESLSAAQRFIDKAPTSCDQWHITTDESPPEGMEK